MDDELVDERFTDGRVARRHRTRQRIVDAHVELIRGGVLRPTAAQIAEAAEVSVRSLWIVFGDMEGLLRATTDYWFEADDRLREPIDLSASLPERIEAFCHERARRLENISPAARAAVLLEPDSPALRESRRVHIQRVIDQVDEVFAAELAGAGTEQQALRDAVVSATSWYLWWSMRTDYGFSPEEAAAAMSLTLHRLLRG